MARKSNSEILSKYRGQLDYSKRWRQNEQYDQLWTRLINLYRGKQYRQPLPYDRLLVNISFATINVLAPAVSVGRPKILVNPRTPEDGDKAILTEAIINYWWQHYDCQTEYQRAVKDFLIIGHGFLKAGYRFVEEEKVNDIEDTADEIAAPPTGEMEAKTIIKEDRPFLERVDPFDMFVDPDGSTMNDIRWIAQRIRRPLKDVKADKRYNATARQEVSATSYSRYGNGYNGSGSIISPALDGAYSSTPDEGYADVWEYYDLEAGTISVFSETGDKFLIKPTKMPFVFGHPFIMLRNYEIPGFFYPMGELEAIEPLQYELNQTRTQMMNHRKRYSRKYIFREDAFDDDGRAALVSDEDNVIVAVKGQENLANVIQPVPAIINPPEFYNQSELITADINRVSGVSEYQRGALPEIRRTATEAAISQDAANARASEKLVIIEKGIAKCGERLIMLAQQYLTGEQTVRIIGTENAPVWLTFDKDYIAGEFDFQVEAGSTAPVNESFRRQMALQMVDAMAPFAQAGLLNLSKLAEYVLSIGFGIKNPESFLQEPPAPGQAAGAEAPVPGQPPMAPGGEQGIPPELMAALSGGAMAPGQPPMAPGQPPMAPGQPPMAPGQAGPGGVELTPEEIQVLTQAGLIQGGQPVPQQIPMAQGELTPEELQLLTQAGLI
jgi:hypothetical protein